MRNLNINRFSATIELAPTMLTQLELSFLQHFRRIAAIKPAWPTCFWRHCLSGPNEEVLAEVMFTIPNECNELIDRKEILRDVCVDVG